MDYTIVINNEDQRFVETQGLFDTSEKNSQLFGYFTDTKVKFGIPTNRDAYKFYTDFEQPSRTETPFLAQK